MPRVLNPSQPLSLSPRLLRLHDPCRENRVRPLCSCGPLPLHFLWVVGFRLVYKHPPVHVPHTRPRDRQLVGGRGALRTCTSTRSEHAAGRRVVVDAAWPSCAAALKGRRCGGDGGVCAAVASPERRAVSVVRGPLSYTAPSVPRPEKPAYGALCRAIPPPTDRPAR